MTVRPLAYEIRSVSPLLSCSHDEGFGSERGISGSTELSGAWRPFAAG
jgi:hypothetical protein